MQARSFEKPRAVARRDRYLERPSITINKQRHLDAGIAKRPDLAEHGRKLAHLAARHRKDDVPGADLGGLRRAPRRETHDNDLVLNLCRVEAEPRTRRPVGAAEVQQVIEDWLEIIDRHDHVEMLALALVGGALELQ